MISVRPIEAGEWRSYRDLRLQSLQDSPDAFASTYESEAGRADEAWSSRLAGAVSSGRARIFVALDHQRMCGVVWCKLPEAGVAEIFQMWVDPAFRGQGAGGALLHEALEWAKSVGVRRVCLGVTAADTPAMALYKACGFRPVGSLEPLRDGSGLMSQPMELQLGAD